MGKLGLKRFLTIISVASTICLCSGCYSPFLNKSRLIVLKPEGTINIKDLMSGDIGEFKGVMFVATFPAKKDGSIIWKNDDLTMTVTEPAKQ